MKPLLTVVLALVLLNSTSVIAQQNNQNRNYQGQYNGRDGRTSDEKARDEKQRKEQETADQKRAEQNRVAQQHGEWDRDDQNRNEDRRNEQTRSDRDRNGENRDYQDRRDSAGDRNQQYNSGSRQATPRWSRGDRTAATNGAIHAMTIAANSGLATIMTIHMASVAPSLPRSPISATVPKQCAAWPAASRMAPGRL